MENTRRKAGLARLIGDRAFYKYILVLALPIAAQQGLTSVVNLLDNVMVGALGTDSISAVAIVNQLVFIFNLTIFGGFSGASIFGAQFAGVKDCDGLKRTFRFKLLLGAAVTALAMALIFLKGDSLVLLYFNAETNSVATMENTLALARSYMGIAVWSLAPFMLSQAYSSTLREAGETVTPMLASAVSLCTNLVLNYILIYGKLGFPAMGVRGAALATAIARYVEAAYVYIKVNVRRDRFAFAVHPFTGGRIPTALLKGIFITGAPLLINEFLWSLGQAAVNKCISVRGLDAVAAVNISGTVWQVFAIGMFAMGSAISIMVGQKLGEGDTEAAMDTAAKMVALNVALNVVAGLLIAALSGVIPQAYNTTAEVRALARGMLIAAGVACPLQALAQGSYFAIRSGGRTVITFLFDSAFSWVIMVPVAYIMCYKTGMSAPYAYFCVLMCNAIKATIGVILLKSGIWARNVISGK